MANNVPIPSTLPKGALTYEQWLAQQKGTNQWATPGIGDGKTTNPNNAYVQNYLAGYKPPATPSNPLPKPNTPPPSTTVVPGKPVANSGQVNVADYASQIVTDPSKALTKDDPKTTGTNESMFLSDHVEGINENAAGTNINPNDPKYAKGTTPATPTATGTTSTAAQVDPRQAATYTAQTTQQNIAQNGQMTAQQGTVSDGALINPDEVPQIDMKGAATGVNADGSINYTGQALNDWAEQNLDDVDMRATTKGQLELLQADFTGPNGEPKIPVYAQGVARELSRIVAFKGMTGTAATAAMANAMMESSISVAQQDAQFYQTLTLQNLSNKQASILNKAGILAKFDEVNADNRMAAAIQNSKNFLEMDLRNLDNKQQAELINTQARVQSILEDAKAVNTQRMFTAEQKNDMGKFYDQLSANINQFNATQKNNMTQFNAGETNSMTKFRAEMETNREQFYKNMQYNIDVSNAKWRQTVTLTENQQQFEAAAADVKNMVGISVEQMNQIWDRSDALLDYLWKSTESQLDRNAALSIEKFRANSAEKSADKAGWGSIVGSIVGAGASSFFDAFDW